MADGHNGAALAATDLPADLNGLQLESRKHSCLASRQTTPTPPRGSNKRLVALIMNYDRTRLAENTSLFHCIYLTQKGVPSCLAKKGVTANDRTRTSTSRRNSWHRSARY